MRIYYVRLEWHGLGICEIKTPNGNAVKAYNKERTYQRPIILRAVESSDAMTADWAKLPYDVLAKISSRIVAEVPGANRVCYDITSKPLPRLSGNKVPPDFLHF